MEKGSSSSSAVNGLKFGKKVYFEDSDNGGGGSPAKKGKSSGGVHVARCQVEGCMIDLSEAKAYYSRHKVCGMHSKSSKVIVAGIEQRFCQQCSRFHKLPEFDQGKRSCRRRLACHNERRRKPPQGSILSSHFGSLSPTTTAVSPMFDNQRKTGGFLVDFSAFSTAPGRESWHNTTPDRGYGNNQLSWQTNSQNPLPNLLQSPTTRPSFSSPGVSSVDSFVSDSNSALSLLSIQQLPWGSRNRPSSLNGFHGANTNGTILVHPLVNSIGQFNGPSDPDLGQTNGQYNTGDLGLAQRSDGRFRDLDHSRGYDSFI